MEKAVMWTLVKRHKTIHQETIMGPKYSKPSRRWLSSNLSTGSVPTCSLDDSECFVYSVVSNAGVLFLVSGYVCKKSAGSYLLLVISVSSDVNTWTSVPISRIKSENGSHLEYQCFTIIECWVSPIADL